MNITRAAIEKNRVTFVCMIVVALAGISAYGVCPDRKIPGSSSASPRC